MIAEGRNINVTLIFSLDPLRRGRSRPTSPAWRLAASGGDLSSSPASPRSSSAGSTPRSTAASRRSAPTRRSPCGARRPWPRPSSPTSSSDERFSGPRWEALAAKGASVQRPLWASTSTKNPAYPDLLYVDSLIGPDTVNTLPDPTVDGFLDHGVVARTVDDASERRRPCSSALGGLGVDMDDVASTLEAEGVASFAKSFDELVQSLTTRPMTCDRLSACRRLNAGTSGSGPPAASPTTASDGSTWPSGCSSRPTISRPGPRPSPPPRIVLLGMGGSSLGPEVLRSFAGSERLVVLDTTDPGHHRRAGARRRFLHRVVEVGRHPRGADAPGPRAGPGARREPLRRHHRPRHRPGRAGRGAAASPARSSTRPDIGGRYSVLSYFGLVPAALLGYDLRTLLRAGDRRGLGRGRRPRRRHGPCGPGGSRQGDHPHGADGGRVRPLGRAARGRVHREAGQGLRARADDRGGDGRRPVCSRRSTSATPSTWAPSSSAGRSPPPSPGTCSTSTPSTSRTSPSRRRTPTRCWPNCHSPTSTSPPVTGPSTGWSSSSRTATTSRSRRTCPMARTTPSRPSAGRCETGWGALRSPPATDRGSCTRPGSCTRAAPTTSSPCRSCPGTPRRRSTSRASRTTSGRSSRPRPSATTRASSSTVAVCSASRADHLGEVS